MKDTDVALLLALFDIASKAKAAIDKIRENNPDAYAEVEAHHAGALARAEAEAAKG